MVKIRPYERSIDGDRLRGCIVELQEFERAIDPRLPAGEEIADDYIADLHVRCHHHRGQILLAEVDETTVGYVVILTRVQSGDLDDGNMEFGLVADLLVKSEYRGTGLGRQLMSAAESHAAANGVRWLRVSVMAENKAAKKLYLSAGFSEIYVDLEKDLGTP